MTQQVSHRPIKCQCRLWSQRGTKGQRATSATTRYSDQQGSKSRQNVMRLCKRHQPMSKRLIKPPYSIYREQPRSTRIVVAYPRSAFSATKRTNYAPTGFDQQVQVSHKHTSYKNNMENCYTEVHGGAGLLELVKPAREPASSRPKPCASLEKSHECCPFAAPCGPRRRKTDGGQRSAFPSKTYRFTPLVLAHRGSALSPGSSTIELPSAFAESSAYPPDRALLSGSPRQLTTVLPASRVPPPSRREPNWSSRKGRTPGNTTLSQPYRRCVSTDRPNREGSQLAASLEGEPGPTPAGKTLPNSYPRFRR